MNRAVSFRVSSRHSDESVSFLAVSQSGSVASTNRPRGGENPLTTGVKQAVPYRTGREARYLSNKIKNVRAVGRGDVKRVHELRRRVDVDLVLFPVETVGGREDRHGDGCAQPCLGQVPVSSHSVVEVELSVLTATSNRCCLSKMSIVSLSWFLFCCFCFCFCCCFV